MKLIGRLILILVAVALVVFSAVNQAPVSVDLWPFPLALDMPLFIVFLGALSGGLFVGAVLFWIPARLWKRRGIRGIRAWVRLVRTGTKLKATEAGA